MKVQVAFEALAVAISIGLLDQPLDAAVHPLAEGVGHSVDKVVEHLWQMVFDHPGNLLDGVESAAHGRRVPVLEEGLGLRPVFAFIEGTEDLLQPPGPGRAACVPAARPDAIFGANPLAHRALQRANLEIAPVGLLAGLRPLGCP